MLNRLHRFTSTPIGFPLVLLAISTSAQAKVPNPSINERPEQSERAVHAPPAHDGFFLRLTSGFGRIGTYPSAFYDDVTGWGFSGSASIGKTLFPNFVLHGDFFTAVAITGESSIADSSEITLNLYGLGAGVTYYFMPINIYVSGSLGVGFGDLVVDDEDEGLSPGFAFSTAVGKEWWVGENWGLGVAFQFFYAALSGYFKASVPSLAAGIQFSATYN